MRPPAIGYLRSDISGVSKAWDQIRIRTTAERLGYQLAKTIEFSQHTAEPVDQLVRAITRTRAEAVVVPSAEHLGGDIPERLILAADVITVSPEATYARRLPTLFDPSGGVAHGHSGIGDRDHPHGVRDVADVASNLGPPQMT